jgi:O-antigen/teichoic acid export membrane protein
LAGVLFLWIVKKYVPWFGIARPKLAELRGFFGLSFWSLAGSVIARVHFGSDVIILGVIASTTAVTHYVLTSYAAQSATSIVSLFFLAVAPGLGGLVGRKQYDRVTAVVNELLAMNWLLVTAVGATIVLWNRSFLSLWVGQEHYAGVWVDLLIVAIMAQTVFIRTYASVINATLRLRSRVLVNAFAAAISITLALALTPFLGILGVCLGIFGGRMIQLVSHPLILNSCLGRRQRLAVKSLTRPCLVLGLLLAGCTYLGQRVLATSWIELVACVGGSLVLLTGLALIAGLSAGPRKSLLRRVQMTLRGPVGGPA